MPGSLSHANVISFGSICTIMGKLDHTADLILALQRLPMLFPVVGALIYILTAGGERVLVSVHSFYLEEDTCQLFT